jgi:hypothetical protein
MNSTTASSSSGVPAAASLAATSTTTSITANAAATTPTSSTTALDTMTSLTQQQPAAQPAQQQSSSPTTLASTTSNAAASTSTTAADNANNNKRALMTHTKDGTQLSEIKLRRLEKNRLSARECRRRKREATETMLHEINLLESENLQLRLQLQIGEEAETSVSAEQQKLTKDIDNLLKSGASEAEIYATLEEFKEKYADYGQSRRSSIEFHLRHIERLLMPTQTTTLVMHAIQGGGGGSNSSTPAHSRRSSFNNNSNTAALIATTAANSTTTADPATSTNSIMLQEAGVLLSSSSQRADATQQQQQPLEPKKLFYYLVKYLQVTPQQAAELKDSRLVAQEMDGCLEQALGVLSELRDRLTQTGEDLETEFNNVRSILTPTQAAKFLIWVANNSACMHMLNELWDRVYPSPSSPTTTTKDSAPS